MTYKWEGVGTKLPSGHMVINTLDNGHGEVGWAIWDESGELPENSDDGVLWLDPTRCLHLSKAAVHNVPVTSDEDGKDFTTLVDATTILKLSRMFNWTIMADDASYYNVR